MGGALGTMQEESSGSVPKVVGPNYITDNSAKVILLASPLVDAKMWRIDGTLTPEMEEREINRMIQNYSSSGKAPEEKIVYYGLNSVDRSPDEQAAKLARHGIEASVYRGGMFEWLLLREIFGADNYPVVSTLATSNSNVVINPLDYLPRL